ncbi:hypothetical protein CBR_g3454 [Chara braunii]|uniref:Uncharacterized protein n=1 Tax=Chara braunii TaxID=69332 RepID=A0A388JQZ9_CHABU|nr:hypothetical protein CBR_g3454 [Chara braunii]|eukprot:GBG60210.1 hypothetical protein CBR_g3454 [Chara braunii]
MRPAGDFVLPIRYIRTTLPDFIINEVFNGQARVEFAAKAARRVPNRGYDFSIPHMIYCLYLEIRHELAKFDFSNVLSIVDGYALTYFMEERFGYWEKLKEELRSRVCVDGIPAMFGLVYNFWSGDWITDHRKDEEQMEVIRSMLCRHKAIKVKINSKGRDMDKDMAKVEMEDEEMAMEEEDSEDEEMADKEEVGEIKEELSLETTIRCLKAVGKKDKGRKKCKADKKKETREQRRSGSQNAKTERTSSRRNGSKVTLPSSQREISKLKERNESPPGTPAPRNRASGVENCPPKAPEKRSREDGMSKVHRRTKKRITYKKDRMVEMIDLRGSNDMHSAAREEAEEEHDQSISEKFDGEENEATSDEGGDSETSDRHSRDTHNADDEDGRSSDGTAQDEGGEGAGEDDRSTDERESSPSPGRT